MAAFGRPVVPEVKAIIATSSAAVCTEANSPALPAASGGEVIGVGRRRSVTIRSPGTPAAASSAVNRWSHSASWTCAISQIVVSSAARSIGMVATATPPALSTPSQHAASHGLFGPRSSTRLPGTSPRSSVSTRAIWLARAATSP